MRLLDDAVEVETSDGNVVEIPVGNITVKIITHNDQGVTVTMRDTKTRELLDGAFMQAFFDASMYSGGRRTSF